MKEDETLFSLALPEMGEGLAELLQSGAGTETPYMREIYLQEQAIVGTRFQGGSDDLVRDLEPGSRVLFVREPENPHDSRAVMALDEKGRKLGYIPRYENGVISALMDAGKVFFGVVTDPQSSGFPAPGTVRTPTALYVSLYMRELALPEDLVRSPRQGPDGSYAVVEFILTDRLRKIGTIFAIKVINGQERDLFHRTWKEDEPEGYREFIGSFYDFAGHLPLVGHDFREDVIPLLEDAYGVQLGIPFSNTIIDTMQMVENHFPRVTDLTLDGLCRRLEIAASGDTDEERRARAVWKLYSKMK